MIKKAIGFGLFILSYPLIFMGGALFVINLLMSSANLAERSMSDFVTPVIMVIVGILCRLIGQRLQRISY